MALDQPKGWISLILGLILMVIGVIPLLATLKVIASNPIAIVTNVLGLNILQYIVAIAGIVLIVDAFMEMDAIRAISLIVGIIIVALGTVPVLSSFGVIPAVGFLSFLTATVYHAIFVIEGLFLVIAAFAMW